METLIEKLQLLPDTHDPKGDHYSEIVSDHDTYKKAINDAIQIVQQHTPWIDVKDVELELYRQYILFLTTGAQEMAQWQGNKFVFRDGTSIGKHRVTHVSNVLSPPKSLTNK